MITGINVNSEHQKKILLLESSSDESRSNADRIRQSGFRVKSVLAEENAVEEIISKRLDIDLIIISTNLALNKLGGEQVLNILMQYEVPILILSSDNRLKQELKIDRETSFRIIDHASDISALDNTIQRVLEVYREDVDKKSRTSSSSVIHQLPAKSESRQFFESSQEAIVFFDAITHQICEVNSSMAKLTGEAKKLMIGKSMGRISFFDSMDISDNLLDNIMADKSVEYVDCKAEKADGKQVFLTVKGETYLSDGRPMIRCTLRETTAAKASEQLLRQELQNKDVMFQELQHRTKNTFSMITGLIELKSMTSESQESKQMLKELAMRVQSTSDMYQLLYEDESSNEVNMANYCAVITKSIIGVTKGITITKKTDDIYVGIKKATSLGLILVELLYNIMKYAFPGDSTDKEVCVELTHKDNGLRLKVSDNGIGLSRDFKVGGSNSSGLSLVYLLAEQLNGTVHISSKNGTTVVVDIKSL